MMLTKIVDRLNRVIPPLTSVFHDIGSVALAMMMFLTATDVFMRYFFNMPITGSYDLTEFLMVIVISFGLAYCALQKGHVKVELVIGMFGQRTQAVINTITCFLSLLLISVIAWQCIKYIKVMYLTKTAYTVILIPVYPSIAIVAFGFFILWLVLLTEFLESLILVIKR